MAKLIHEMKQERHAKVGQMRGILDRCDAAHRNLTPDENKEYRRLEAEIDQMDNDILAAEQDLERRRALAEREMGVHKGRLDVHPEREFRNLGECLWAVARLRKDNVDDPRLTALREKREQQMGVGSTGGYALPEQFDATVRRVNEQEGIVRSRATAIPAGEPPDAVLRFPSLDQTSAQNIYGGVTLAHTGEGVTMTETEAALREVSFEPKEISAYVVVTNKLLNNWTAAGPFFGNLLSRAMVGQEDYDFLRGDGVNKALGVLNSAAAIVHSRAGANAISFNDTIDMMSKMLMRGNAGSYIWLASQTTIPQLGRMVDVGNHSVWIGSSAAGLQGAAGPLPSTLHGIPVVFSDRLPALGQKGDLNLVNLSYYLVKDGSGPFIASSEHIYFLSNKTVFKIVWNVDGHPWLTEPLQLEGAAGSTVSPFVVLE